MNKNQIDKLAQEIIRHRHLYYNEEPIISDPAFDLLIDELKLHDPTNQAITSIGAPIKNEEWKKVKHDLPLGSLNKAKNPQELSEWVKDIFSPSNSIFIIEKMDGGSLEVIYENGKFIRAISRGDGHIGLDIGPNVLKMRGVKKNLPIKFTGSLRGELICTKENFNKHFPNDANPRNTANGVSKRLDGEGCQFLDVFFYQCVGNVDFESEFLQLQFIEDQLKLSVPKFSAYVGNTVDDLISFTIKEYDRYIKIRDNLEYDIDGLVVKINDLKTQSLHGEKDLRPKFAIALKFPSEEGRSVVKEVRSQVGGSGRITPVVEIDPISLAGSTVSRASLYNYGYINEIGLDVGAEVIVCKAGDIIPRCETVIKSTDTVFKAPTKCPVCNGEVELRGEHLFCVSTDTCPAQIEGRILAWISNLNILEWGDALVQRLVSSGQISTIVDLYLLTPDTLSKVERMGCKSAQKCYDSLWSHNPIPLEQFLGSLSIPFVGSLTIKLLIENGLNSIEKILKASEEDFASVKGIGPIKAKSIYNGLKKNRHIITGLFECGLAIKERKMGKLDGLSFCFTGALSTKRKVWKELVEDNGGTFKSSVGKDCTYLVMADADSNSSKAQKAKQLGTKILSEDQLSIMIHGS